MTSHTLTPAVLPQFLEYLKADERETATIEKYVHEVSLFIGWIGD